MNDNSILIELHYLPCIEYFCQFLQYDEIYIEKHEIYTKQSYRNRCRIRGSNKIENLIVPIKHRGKQKITDIEIDYDQKWLGVHQRAIMSAYGKAAFYEHFGEEFLTILRKRYRWLFELNYELLSLCLKLLKLECQIKFTDRFENLHKNDQIDLRGEIHPKKRGTGMTNFTSFPYTQVFGSNFVENLSIIDLLFCYGNMSKGVLTKSIKKFENKSNCYRYNKK